MVREEEGVDAQGGGGAVLAPLFGGPFSDGAVERPADRGYEYLSSSSPKLG